jgi:hypothetical protein
MDNDSTTMFVTSNWPCGSQPLLTRRSCLRPQPWLHRPTISGNGMTGFSFASSRPTTQIRDFILERLSAMASAPETARMPIFRQEGTLATPDLSFLRSPTCVDATIGRICSLLGVRMFTLLPRITRTWVHGSVSAFMSLGRLFCQRGPHQKRTRSDRLVCFCADLSGWREGEISDLGHHILRKAFGESRLVDM